MSGTVQGPLCELGHLILTHEWLMVKDEEKCSDMFRIVHKIT